MNSGVKWFLNHTLGWPKPHQDSCHLLGSAGLTAGLDLRQFFQTKQFYNSIRTHTIISFLGSPPKADPPLAANRTVPYSLSPGTTSTLLLNFSRGADSTTALVSCSSVDNPFCEEIIPNIQHTPPLAQPEAVSSCSVTWEKGPTPKMKHQKSDLFQFLGL